jgi:HemY protein
VLFWILAGLTLAVGLTLAAKFNTGMVLLALPPYRVEMSLNLFLLLSLGLFMMLYGAVRLAYHMVSLPAYVHKFKDSRRRKRAREAFNEALTAFFEGRFAIAEKNAASATAQGEMPAISALLAARAAHEQHDFERRDAYLAQAERQENDQPVARLITQAELLLDERRTQSALAVLRELEKHGRKHAHVLRLELKAQQQAKNWDQVPPLVAQLVKREALDPSQAEPLLVNAYGESLKRKAVEGQVLRELWNKIPNDYRLNNKVALQAGRAFLAAGDHQAAVEVATKSLDEHWDTDLAHFYGTCYAKDVLKQIERAENWLHGHPRDAALLLSLARLCAKQELWGKARSYLEASLAVEPGAESHLLMAQLLEKLQQPEEACRHYRQSLELCRQEA